MTAGEFTLGRQRGGTCYFGHARVRLVPGSSHRWAVDPDDRTSLQPRSDPDLVEAAVSGAADGVALMRECGVSVEGWCVEIVHAQVDLVDIEASAVRAAAAMAVAEAFGAGERVALGFDSGWFVLLNQAGTTTSEDR